MSDHSEAGPQGELEDKELPQGSSGDRAKRPREQNEDEEQPVGADKRPRGPYDCLDWSDEEEEFVPYTQSSSPPKVFAKKTIVKNVSKKKRGAKNAGKVKGSSASAKGKSIGKHFLICVLNLFYGWSMGLNSCLICFINFS